VALEGYCLRRLTLIERVLAFACGIALIFPTGSSDLIGLGLFVVLLVMQALPWGKPRPQHADPKQG
jgi:TRAP-type uncharacterized transport system fused permease subunit